jgi:hypothetical protein
MAKALTARYGAADAARNAHEDLVGVGYPREKLWLDVETAQVKVIAAEDAEREAREILDRHQPDSIDEREF